MRPIFMNPLHVLAGVAITALVAGSAGFASGWTVQGWRKDAAIADLKKARAEELSAQTKAALDTLATDIKGIKESADKYVQFETSFGQQMNRLHKELKNVQASNPLPVDCRPDALRLHSLKAAVDAANKTTAGRESGETVSRSGSP